MPPKDPIWDIMKEVAPQIEENSVLVVTSKIVSIHQGRTVLISKHPDKDKLIIENADLYLPRDKTPFAYMHTITHNTLIPTAGIDASNANDYYILPLKNPQRAAKQIWQFLATHTKTKQFGVIIADSHSIPMRWGVVGISLSYFGFKPLKDYRGKSDIFGRIMKVSMANIPDSLASAATFAMGEGAEQTPLALITDLPAGIEFTSKIWSFKTNDEFGSKKIGFYIPPEYDLYAPLLKKIPWKKGGGRIN